MTRPSVQVPVQKLHLTEVHLQIALLGETTGKVLADGCNGPCGKTPLANSWYVLLVYHMASFGDPRRAALGSSRAMQSLRVKAVDCMMMLQIRCLHQEVAWALSEGVYSACVVASCW